MSEHSVSEMTASRIFMVCVSSQAAMASKKLDQILGSNKEPRSDATYTVEFRVNGVELDFKDFEARCVAAFDSEITEAAARLVKEQIGDSLFKMTDKVNEALEELTEGVRRKASEALGFDPWADGQRDRDRY